MLKLLNEGAEKRIPERRRQGHIFICGTAKSSAAPELDGFKL